MTKKHDHEQELTAVEAATKLGVGLQYLYGLVRTGRLKARKVEERWQISAEAVEARLRQRGE